MREAARRWLAPEIVQTSSMDCGPAALKCLLEGYRVAASYGRLREACQTSVDGTSIDVIETVAGQLGLEAEQVLVPADHIALRGAGDLPALVVVRHADNATHFVVVWRRHGSWLQIMDPALGRRWVHEARFREDIFRHRMSVPAADWRAWAGGEECRAAWRARAAILRIDAAEAEGMVAEVLADPLWFPAAAFDASLRLVHSLVAAGGVDAGAEAARLVASLTRKTIASEGDIFSLISPNYWSVAPDPEAFTRARPMLRINGGVLLKIGGRRNAEAGAAMEPLAPELAAALAERPANPLRSLLAMLKEDGVATPIALTLAMAIASGALMLEALLFRGMLDIAPSLALGSQRLAAGAALILLMAALLAFELAVGSEVIRSGRALEARLRMALLAKLPRLADRYFQSRPITDMADRSHNIQLVRTVPALGMQFVQAGFELVLTVAAIALIAPASAGWALATAMVAIALPFAVQPLLNERDLRVRNQAGALHGFYLDAILGLAPIRAHRAERNVQRQHEGLLVEWAQSLRGLMRFSILANGVQGLIGTGLAAVLILRHFATAGTVGGADLLLVFWVLKLPSIGGRIAGLAQSYPARRNALLRLIEPLNAPDEPVAASPARPAPEGPAAIALDRVQVLAGGHTILDDITLSISPGEHVAIVGLSGAGKSSLIGLLLGWHRASAGQVTVDGEPLDAAGLERLRRTSAWVDPGLQIWNRSLLDNLLYAANDEDIERVGEVVDAASLRGLTRKLPEGLQTLLGEGGGLLSGGEGQRVRLGRALLASGTCLALLDEPFRGLDRGQRRRLLGEARAWWGSTTLLCVTHDIAETLDFDRVLVIENGRLIEDGRPAALAARPSRYRALIAAEEEVGSTLWHSRQWRRLTMTSGRLSETGEAK